MTTTNMICSGDFVVIVNPDLKQDGFEVNDVVYVAALKAFPLEKDSYTQRIKLFVHKTTNDYIDIQSGVFVIDPASVEKVADYQQKYLVNQYAPKEEDASLN